MLSRDASDTTSLVRRPQPKKSQASDLAPMAGLTASTVQDALLYPNQNKSHQPPFRGAIETFPSRATSLPLLPKNRSTNITVFPAGLMSDPFGGDGGRQEKPRSVWCLVDVSELEHCERVCGCPDRRRGCETCCAGWGVFLPVPPAVVR